MNNKIFFILINIYSILYSNNVDNDASKNADTRIKIYNYNINKIYDLDLVANFRTQIVFDINEKIHQITFGNGQGIEVYHKINVLYLKPLYIGIQTNLIVDTNMRKYIFSLKSQEDAGVRDDKVTYLLSFRYLTGGPNNSFREA